MDTPKISVIVPVYNTALYLRKCVESLLAQTLTDFEIILIDDGSSDDSPSLCDDYARSDRRIRAIHQKNKGEGGSRKVGVSLAAGEYILFVDSDDWIEPQMLAVMYDAAKNNDCDLVLCDWKVHDVRRDRVVDNDQLKYLQDRVVYDRHKIEEVIFPIFLLEQIPGYLWNKMFKTAHLQQCDLEKIPELPNNEDWVWNCEYLLKKTTRMLYVHHPLYHYALRESNSLRGRYRDHFSVALKLHEYRMAYLHRFNLEGRKDIRLGVIHRFLNMALYAAFNYEFLFPQTPLRQKLQRISAVVHNPEVRLRLRERGDTPVVSLESTHYVSKPGIVCDIKWFLFELGRPFLIYMVVSGFEMARRVIRGKRDVRDVERAY